MRVVMAVALICVMTACARAEELGRLERVVVVERHGVRAPTKPPAALAPYSATAWPEWPVAPGELTPHGVAGIRLMGRYLREIYGARGVLPASGCPAKGGVFVWADSADHRTMQSGDALLEGLAPGCGLSAQHATAGSADPLFSAAETGKCPIDPAQVKEVLETGLRHLTADPASPYASSLAALAKLLRPSGCDGQDRRCFPHGQNSLAPSEDGMKVKGPLATGSTLTEALSLEYDEGMQGQSLGWGRMDFATLSAVMPLHVLYSDLTRHNPIIAGHNAALMARALLKALAGEPGFPGQAAPSAAFVGVLGHDTTLANLGGVLGVNWTLPGQPDSTPPGGALVFEVFASASPATRQVRVHLLYQTADQIRTLAELNAAHPPGSVDLTPSLCHAQSCTLAELQTRMAAAIPPTCQ